MGKQPPIPQKYKRRFLLDVFGSLGVGVVIASFWQFAINRSKAKRADYYLQLDKARAAAKQ